MRREKIKLTRHEILKIKSVERAVAKLKKDRNSVVHLNLKKKKKIIWLFLCGIKESLLIRYNGI